MDCFVASLLAMTNLNVIASRRRSNPQKRSSLRAEGEAIHNYDRHCEPKAKQSIKRSIQNDEKRHKYIHQLSPS